MNIKVENYVNNDNFFNNYKQQIQIKIKSRFSTSEIFLIFYLYYYMIIDNTNIHQINFFSFLNFNEIFNDTKDYKLWIDDFDDIKFLFDKDNYNYFN